jgi:hypothetical protein
MSWQEILLHKRGGVLLMHPIKIQTNIGISGNIVKSMNLKDLQWKLFQSNKTSADSNGDDTQVDRSSQVEPAVVLPPDIKDPEQILHRHVHCYVVSGLLSSFPRESLNKVVHESLIDYP